MTDKTFQLAAFALLAAFGALARQLHIMGESRVRIIHFISGCIIASFMGVIIFFVTENLNISNNLLYALSGISGWIGPQFLDWLLPLVLKLTGVDYNPSKDASGGIAEGGGTNKEDESK